VFGDARATPAFIFVGQIMTLPPTSTSFEQEQQPYHLSLGCVDLQFIFDFGLRL
jgi:hypothetical protein